MPMQDLNPFGTAGEPAVSGTGTAGTSVTGVQPAATQSQDQADQLQIIKPSGPGGTYTLQDILAQNEQELQAAYKQAQNAASKAQDLYSQLKGMSSDDPNYVALYRLYEQSVATQTAAQARIAAASQSRSTYLVNAIQNQALLPSEIARYTAEAEQAKAQAAMAQAQADALNQAAPGQRQLVSAQTGLANAQAQLQSAQAAQTSARTQPEADLLRAQAAQAQAQIPIYGAQVQQMQAQAGLLGAQAGLTQAQTQVEQAQAGVAPRAAEATTRTLEAQAAQQQALAGLAPQTAAATLAQLQATAGLTGAESTAQLAGAATNIANIQKGLQGPVYGLQDQINAIRAVQQQVFGPGGSGNPDDANALLGQYITAAIGGTTPFAAATTAGLYGQQAYQTAATMANQLAADAASRANAFQSFGGGALGTLAAMNVNAPKGSTALAGAFADVMNQMQQRLQAPQFQPPPMPQAPQLPPFLQQFAAGGAGLPTATSAPGGTTAPVTINIGAGAQPGAAPPAAAPPVTAPQPGAAPDWYTQWQQRQAADVGQQQAARQLPGVLQPQQPADLDYVHQLWGNELGSGAVTSPYATAGAGA